MQNLNDELDALRKESERLDLTKSLQFDELTRQIDQAANSMQELPFNEIMAGIAANKSVLVGLTGAWDQASAAVRNQQGVVDALTASRDDLQSGYDREALKLKILQNAYDDVASAISDVSAAMDTMTNAAQSASDAAAKTAGDAGYVSPALQNFLDSAGGDFADVSGTGALGREGDLTDQSALIDEFTNSVADDIGNMFADIDIFGPIKDQWGKVVDVWKTGLQWIEDNKGILIGISSIFTMLMIPRMITWATQTTIQFGRVVATWVWTSAKAWFHAAQVVAAWAWTILKFTAQVILWGVQAAIVVAKWAWMGVQALLHSGKVVLAWVGTQIAAAAAAGSTTASSLVIFGVWARHAAISALNAAKIAGSWLVVNLGSQKAAATYIANSVLFLGLWAEQAAKSVVGAAKTAGSWLVIQLAAIRTGIVTAGVWAAEAGRWIAGQAKAAWGAAKVVGAWVLMGAQSLLQAGRMAIAWVIAMGPVGWLIGLLILIVAAVIVFWDDIVGIFTQAWDGVKNAWSGVGDFFIGLVDNIKLIWSVIVEWFKTLFTNAWNGITHVWSVVVSWFAGVWQGIKDVWNVVTTFFSNLFSNAWNGIKNAWSGVLGWFGGIWESIKGVFANVVSWFSSLWTNVVTGIGNAWRTIQGVVAAPINWVIRNVWNNGLLKAWNWIIGLFGVAPVGNMSEISYATGGVVPGWSPGKDDQLAAVSGGEAIMRPEWTRAVGESTVNHWNEIARTHGSQGVREAIAGGVPQFYAGGVYKKGKDQSQPKGRQSGGFWGSILDIAGLFAPRVPFQKEIQSYWGQEGDQTDRRHGGAGQWDQALGDWVGSMANKAWDSVVNAFQNFLGGSDWLKNLSGQMSGIFAKDSTGWPARVLGILSSNTMAARNFIFDAFREISSIGTLGSRPNVSDHPYGKAMDVMIPGWSTPQGKSLGYQVAGSLAANSMRYGLKYLIFNDAISEGSGWKPYTHPNGPTENATLRHLDHVHASFYDDGGILGPGTGGFNTSGLPERVLNPRQTVSFERLVDLLADNDRATIRSLLGSALPTPEEIATGLMRAEARLRRTSDLSGATIQIYSTHTETNTIVINGNLEFPNIKSGSDSSKLISNLQALAKE